MLETMIQAAADLLLIQVIQILLNFVISAGALKKYFRVFVTEHFKLYYLVVKVAACFMCMINLVWSHKIN